MSVNATSDQLALYSIMHKIHILNNRKLLALFFILTIYSSPFAQQGTFCIGFVLGIPKGGITLGYSITDNLVIKSFFNNGLGTLGGSFGAKYFFGANKYNEYITFGYTNFGQWSHEFFPPDSITFNSKSYEAFYLSLGNDFNLNKGYFKMPVELGITYFIKGSQVHSKTVHNQNKNTYEEIKEKIESEKIMRWRSLLGIGANYYFKLKGKSVAR